MRNDGETDVAFKITLNQTTLCQEKNKIELLKTMHRTQLNNDQDIGSPCITIQYTSTVLLSCTNCTFERELYISALYDSA